VSRRPGSRARPRLVPPPGGSVPAWPARRRLMAVKERRRRRQKLRATRPGHAARSAVGEDSDPGSAEHRVTAAAAAALFLISCRHR